MLSTCRVLVKNLKGSEFNVSVSETVRLEIIFMSSFLKREITPQKSHGFIRGCTLAANNNETFCIYMCILGPSS